MQATIRGSSWSACLECLEVVHDGGAGALARAVVVCLLSFTANSCVLFRCNACYDSKRNGNDIDDGMQ